MSSVFLTFLLDVCWFYLSLRRSRFLCHWFFFLFFCFQFLWFLLCLDSFLLPVYFGFFALLFLASWSGRLDHWIFSSCLMNAFIEAFIRMLSALSQLCPTFWYVVFSYSFSPSLWFPLRLLFWPVDFFVWIVLLRCNLHRLYFTHLKYTIWWSSVSSQLCNHHYNQI